MPWWFLSSIFKWGQERQIIFLFCLGKSICKVNHVQFLEPLPNCVCVRVCVREGGGKGESMVTSSGVFWLQAILIKMIGNDHRGKAQLAWIFLPAANRRQVVHFRASSAIQPPRHANYLHCLSSWVSQPSQLIAPLSISKIVFDFKGELNEYQGIFIAEHFLWELADSVGGKNELHIGRRIF